MMRNSRRALALAQLLLAVLGQAASGPCPMGLSAETGAHEHEAPAIVNASTHAEHAGRVASLVEPGSSADQKDQEAAGCGLLMPCATMSSVASSHVGLTVSSPSAVRYPTRTEHFCSADSAAHSPPPRLIA